MLTIGHRGAMGHEPENTMSSFRKALELGVDMIELDVHVCKSGEVVVIHDETVDRTTDGSGYVAEKTLEELQSLDAGNGEKVPTLESIFKLVNQRAIINIEIKGADSVVPVKELIHTYIQKHGWRYDDFLISSFDHHNLVALKALSPSMPTAALVSCIPLSYARVAEDVGAYAIHPNVEFVNQAFVDDAHSRGLKVFVWTVNDESDIKKMQTLHVDGVITDYPDRV